MQIGPINLRNNTALAPMAGFADVPFRTLAWRMGVGYMVAEMVSAKPDLWETGKSSMRRRPVPGADPVAVQIAGSDPRAMAVAARRHVDEGVDVIDINFGCPAKKVCRRAAGSALLADVDLIGHIVEAVATAVDVPVTIKTRLGLTREDDAGATAVRVAADAGAQMAVVHGRSKACRFGGRADYAAVARVKAGVAIPVMVNGDVTTPAAFRRALAESGADGVMVGRGAIGRPWLFRELLGEAPLSDAEKWRVVEDHVRLSHDFYGAELGVRLMRKHLKAYFRELGCSSAVAEAMRYETLGEQLSLVRRLGARSSFDAAA